MAHFSALIVLNYVAVLNAPIVLNSVAVTCTLHTVRVLISSDYRLWGIIGVKISFHRLLQREL